MPYLRDLGVSGRSAKLQVAVGNLEVAHQAQGASVVGFSGLFRAFLGPVRFS